MNDQNHQRHEPPGPGDEATSPADAAVADESQVQAAGGGETAQLRQEVDELRDRAMRSQADLENYRKRARRELEDERRYAILPLLADLLGVADNVGRAIAAAEKTPEAGGLLEGVKLVSQQLQAVLAKYNCRRIEALGKPFDPHLHSAVSQQPSAEHEPNTVIQVVQDGYQLHDRVVRPAQVIISTAPA